jgi:hypothetical protein
MGGEKRRTAFAEVPSRGEVSLGPGAVLLVQGSVEASEAQVRYGRVLAHRELQGPTTARGYGSGGQRCAV